MASIVSPDRLRFLINRFRERLWAKPLVICLLSIAAAFAAKLTDGTGLAEMAPEVTEASVETLLSVMAASMLLIATFAVGSMVSAYASASSAATPRSFSLVVADDVSQNALSTFIGAFIFSLVALISMKNDFFGVAGRFSLLILTVTVFAMVIGTFVRWVDCIARLGRLGTTIDRVEKATAQALERRRRAPTLHGAPVSPRPGTGQAVFAKAVGYVQHIDIAALQECAEAADARIVVAALPGTFAFPGRPMANVFGRPGESTTIACEKVAESFLIGDSRLFDDDPRFGLVALSEIAGRALSPGINDPGTAIDIIGTLVRLFAPWGDPATSADPAPRHDRVEVPEISVEDLFDDAFTAIGRDGAGTVEVTTRLLKALRSLSLAGKGTLREAAIRHGRLALARAESALSMEEDRAIVRDAARFTQRADAA